MHDTPTIRARIHDSAIRRVTRTFAAGLADIFTETLQNSRRAGATRVRVAVTGRKAAPPLFETMAVLGRDKSLDRLRKSLDVLRGG